MADEPKLQKFDAPAPTAKQAKAPATPPKGLAVTLSKEEWAAIHSDKPESIYELRPRAWRPAQTVTRTVDAPCPICGARVQEMIGPTECRCMGCGTSPVKD